jgi:hypothetical protein
MGVLHMEIPPVDLFAGFEVMPNQPDFGAKNLANVVVNLADTEVFGPANAQA